MKFRHAIWHLEEILIRKQVFSQNEFVILTHLGLGDLISVFPGIYSLTTSGKIIHLPCKQKNLKAIKEIYEGTKNLVIFPVPDDRHLEVAAVRNYAEKSNLPILYSGYVLYSFAEKFKIGLGINGLLNYLLGYEGELTAQILKEKLLSKGAKSKGKTPENYIFLDHNEREFPRELLKSQTLGKVVIENQKRWNFSDLACWLDEAQELHLISSAPLCLALVANLGPAGNRYRYRTEDSFPLRLDYPSDWVEISVSNNVMQSVDRGKEAQQSLPGSILRSLLRLTSPPKFKRRK